MIKYIKQMKTDKQKYITLNSSQVNAGVIAEYKRELLKLVQKMIYGYTKEILELFKDNKTELKQMRYATDTDISDDIKKKMDMLNDVYTRYFAQNSKSPAQNMVNKTAIIVKTNWTKEYAKFMFLVLQNAEKHPEDKVFNEFIKNNFAPMNFMRTPAGKKAFAQSFALNTSAYSEVAEQIKQMTINNNGELIKSIHQQYHREISQALYNSIINGKSIKTIKEALLEAGVKTKRRAGLIAQDQCNKINSALQMQELKEIGVKKVKWIHVGGGKTDRKTHITPAPKGLNGAIFDINKGIYDPAVQKNIKPAELPFCRCQAVAVMEI